MNHEEIMKILPHRNSMLLLDEAFVDEEGAAHGKLTIRGDEFFLDGHFPGNPIVPGVILCEILAQSACVLLAGDVTEGGKKSTLYTGLDKVKFKHPVRPDDTFETTCRIVRSRPPFYFCEGEGKVDGKLCLKAEFSFAVTEAAE